MRLARHVTRSPPNLGVHFFVATPLGTVEHVVKIGGFHGIDDPFYVDRYKPTLWALPGATHERGVDHRQGAYSRRPYADTRCVAVRF